MTLQPNLPNIALLPGAAFLIALPFTHTVALRLTMLFVFAVIVVFQTTYFKLSPHLKYALIAWAGLAMLSLLWATDPAYSFNEIKNEIGYTLLTFFAFYRATQTQRAWRLLNLALILGFVAVSISGVFAYWFATPYWQKGGVHGGVGDYSTYLIMIMPLIFLWTLQNTHWRSRTLLLLLLPLALLGGYLTLNRAFWPAFIAVLCVFWILFIFPNASITSSIKLSVVVLALIVIAGLLFTTSATVKSPVQGTRAEILAETVQQDPRLQLWKFALTQIERRPLTGAGFGRAAAKSEFFEHFDNADFWHAHNLVINYALQLGLGGILVLALVFGALVKEFWGMYRSENYHARLIGITGIALIAGTITKNITDDFFVRQHSLLFWAIVGMTMGYGKTLFRKESVDGSPSFVLNQKPGLV